MTQLLARAEKAGDKSEVGRLAREFVELFEFVGKMPNCTEGNLEGFLGVADALRGRLDGLREERRMKEGQN